MFGETGLWHLPSCPHPTLLSTFNSSTLSRSAAGRVRFLWPRKHLDLIDPRPANQSPVRVTAASAEFAELDNVGDKRSLTKFEERPAMGSSVVHLRRAPRENVLQALDNVLFGKGLVRAGMVDIPARGPYSMPDQKSAMKMGPCYHVSQLSGDWITILEGHSYVQGAPNITDLGLGLGSLLTCYALSVAVHDDDVFLYALYRENKLLDHYNSNPQYFEQKRVPESVIKQQRHSVQPFDELLPKGRDLQELRTLLQRGWWNSHDKGKLDSNGVARAGDGFVFESERMTEFGNLLKLHGGKGKYPFAAWGNDRSGVDWKSFISIRYRPS
jgi:hypothetical protein